MNRLMSTAMAGANAAMARQEMHAHNLANASTPGFRADISALQAEAQANRQPGAPAKDAFAGADFAPGPITQTGGNLDIAINGKGWIAVEGRDGREAYTRNGGLQVGASGVLQTINGLNVLSDGGPIAIPANASVRIASDGTVSALPEGQSNAVINVGRIKLVNPPEQDLARSSDGLFRLRNGGSAPLDDALRVATGSIEGSNVNVVEELVGMIALARQFELHMKMMQNTEAGERDAARLLSIQS